MGRAKKRDDEVAGELLAFPITRRSPAGETSTPAGFELANQDTRTGDEGGPGAASDTARPFLVASPGPGRNRVIAWARYHRLELTSVVLPLVLAALHGWVWLIPAAMSAVGWLGQEIHERKTNGGPDDE